VSTFRASDQDSEEAGEQRRCFWFPLLVILVLKTDSLPQFTCS
jgi:hypothetical protein